MNRVLRSEALLDGIGKGITGKDVGLAHSTISYGRINYTFRTFESVFIEQ